VILEIFGEVALLCKGVDRKGVRIMCGWRHRCEGEVFEEMPQKGSLV
jgi:hypothetical protein